MLRMRKPFESGYLMAHRPKWILVLTLLSIFTTIFKPPKAFAEPQFVLTINVKDPSGAVIPGAHVKLTKGPDDQGVTVNTDNAGTVSLHLSRASYRLSVSMDGFKSETQEVVLGDSNEQTVTIVLRVGGCPVPDPCPVILEQGYSPEKGNTQVAPRLSEVKATVVDTSGAVIPRCEIAFTSNSKRVVSHTGADGSVTVTLPSGTYTVTATHDVFLKNETLDFQISAPSPRELNIVMKLDPDFCKNGRCDCSGPTCGGAGVIVPINTPGLTGPTASEHNHPLASQPTTKKSRSWQCLYLWKCSIQ